MKNEGKLLLAAFGRFLAYCLLAALPVFVLRQDLLGAGNTLGERSLVELTQTGFLLASSASFAVLAWRCAQERRFALLASAFFMVMLLREQDAWLDVLIGHGAWKLLAVPIALAALVWAAADWRASVGALLRFVSSRAGTLMLLGLAHFSKTPLGDPNDVNDVARRLSEAGVTARIGATIHPARDEYQNFGVVQAMDHLAVLGDLLQQGAAFDAARIIALGSSHGGYIAHMIAKIAPRTLAMVIDNSSYTQPPMEYLGQPASADFIAPLAGDIMAFCRTKSGWTTDNRQAVDFYSRDRDLIRDVAYPPHLAAARAEAGDDATIFRMVNAATDGISPPHMKQRQVAALQALGFDGQLSLIEEEHLDGTVFKQLVHGLDASLAGLFDMAIPELRPRSGQHDGALQASVAYECVDSIYRFTHSSIAPFIHGDVKSRFFENS